MKTNIQYVERSSRCPYCDHDKIESSGNLEVEGNTVFQDIECHTCGAMWTDQYELVRYVEIQPPPVRMRAEWVKLMGKTDTEGKQMIEQALPEDITAGRAFIALYQLNIKTQRWEWVSDYVNEKTLFEMTGITRVLCTTVNPTKEMSADD